jgi:tripartite-type tricarboxylate transporter receptor subunit TctC
MAFAAAFPATAAEFPDHPVRIVVPASAGGASDILARMIAKKVGDEWRQPLVVDNRPGASGLIGNDMVAKAAGDGYTALVGSTILAQAPALYPKLAYDVLKDLTPVTIIALSANALIVPADSPAKTLPDFVKLVKANPKSYSFASNGNATTSHMQGFQLNKIASLDMVHVPFKGSAPQLQAVLAGEVNSAIIDLGSSKPQIVAGRVRALAVTGETRLKSLPNVPTFKELGFQGFESVGWFALMVPSATPKDIVAKYAQSVRTALQSPEVVAKIEEMGLGPISISPEDFAKKLRSDINYWAGIVKEQGIKLD